LFLFITKGLPPARSDKSNTIPSAASSVTLTSEACFLTPHQEVIRPKRKSPPVGTFPISCLKCFENNDDLVKADFESKTVICKKCNYIAGADEYDSQEFTKACLYDKKEPASSGFKRHAETAYLSCLADNKRLDNEKSMIKLKEIEFNQKAMEAELAQREKSSRLELELKLEEKRVSGQEQLLKMHTEANAAMHELMQSFIPKKSPLEKYREQKAAITAMLAAGDITGDVANQLIEKLNNELLSSNLI
jgi:hypothetical protein